MSNEVMNVLDIMGLEKDHYEAGDYRFSVDKAEVIETRTGRKGIKMTLKINDTEVLKGDRLPLGEKMWKTLYFPTSSDKETSRTFMGRLVQEFLMATQVSNHPDYVAVASEGVDNQALWDLVIGSVFDAKVTWLEKKEKNNETGKYEGTGDMEQDIKKFKAIRD